MMPVRRDAFSKLKAGDGEPAAHIPPARSKAKRNREWEKAHAVVAYRGIPDELQEEIRRIAEKELGVPMGEVARAFLEHGLAAYRAGELRLTAQPVTGRLSLFPPPAET